MWPTDSISEGVYWQGHLAKWPKWAVEALCLPDSSLRYLEEVGLPIGLNWQFDLRQPSIPLTRLGLGRSFVQIGQVEPVPICLDEARNGMVVCLEDNIGPGVTLNSSVEKFGRCLMYYQMYREEVAQLDEQAADYSTTVHALIEDVERLMKQADSYAFADPANGWPVILEQVREGNL